MAQHVRVDRKLDAGVATGPPDHLADGVGCQRRLALADEHVGRFRVVPLQTAQGTQLWSPQGMDRCDAVLQPRDVKKPVLKIDLIPTQADQFRHT